MASVVAWCRPVFFCGLLALACGGSTTAERDSGATDDCNASGGTGCATPATKPAICTAPVPPPPAPCPAGYFAYVDSLGGPTGPGTYASSPVGDGLCYQRCETDRDCTDPCRSLCRTLGLFSGGDYKCNASVRICGTRTTDECP